MDLSWSQDRVGDAPVVGVRALCVRIREMRIVERIEEFRPHLAPNTFVDRDKSYHGDINVLLSWTSQKIPRRISERRLWIERRVGYSTYVRVTQGSRTRSDERSLIEEIIQATGCWTIAFDLPAKRGIEVGATEDGIARIIYH